MVAAGVGADDVAGGVHVVGVVGGVRVGTIVECDGADISAEGAGFGTRSVVPAAGSPVSTGKLLWGVGAGMLLFGSGMMLSWT